MVPMISERARRLGVAAQGVLARLGHRSSSNLAQLRSIVLLENDIAQSCEFFRQGLGGRIVVATEGWAEVEVGRDGGGDGAGRSEAPVLIHLKKRRVDDSHSESDTDASHTSQTRRRDDVGGANDSGPGMQATGHATDTPTSAVAPTALLVFNVRDVQACLMNMLQHGGHMDGRIEYSPDGTTQAVVRSPGGTNIGLVGRS